MRTRTAQWAKLAARGYFNMETKARINGKDYTAISAPVIERPLLPSPISVGNCISATLNVSVLTEDQIDAASTVVILGRLTDGNVYSEWKEFGTFFINQRDTSFEGLVTLECYDAMLKANQIYHHEGDSTTGWPKLMIDVVSEIANYLGVGIDPRTLIFIDGEYVVPFPLGLTMLQVLGDIGACHGGNWIITEANELRLVPLVTSPDDTFHIINEDYETVTTSDDYTLAYKEQETFNPVLPSITYLNVVPPSSSIRRTHYVVDEHGSRIVTSDGYTLIWTADGTIEAADGLINVPVVCGELTTGKKYTVTGVSVSDTSGNTYAWGDNSGIVLKIENNPYATQIMALHLYILYNGLVYSPFTATNAVFDPATELGDQVKIGDSVQSVVYGMRMTLDSNFRADISAPNSEELLNEYPYPSEIEKLRSEIKEIKEAVNTTSPTTGSIGSMFLGMVSSINNIISRLDALDGGGSNNE